MTVISDIDAGMVLSAPLRLTADTRLEFRRQAIEHLDALARREATALELDLRATSDIDASGLGILVLLQKRAREAGMATRVRGARPLIRQTIEGARLDHLFEFRD